MARLKGKIAIITGAAQGMLTDISEGAGRKLAAELGANAAFMLQDVAPENGWKAVVAETERRFGPVNVLVNNAGVNGPIVNVSSIAGLVAIYGTPSSAYTGSKFAVRGMSKHVAIEYAARNIRCNSVHPGYVRTPMKTEALNPEQIVVASGSVPVKRVGEPSEVASLIVFLASDESAFITGAEHVIDGGLTAL